MFDVPVIYSDDTDAYLDWTITDRTGQELTWTPTVAFDAGAYEVAAEWQGDVGSTRVLRVPVDGSAHDQTMHTVYLQVADGVDQRLGQFTVAARR